MAAREECLNLSQACGLSTSCYTTEADVWVGVCSYSDVCRDYKHTATTECKQLILQVHSGKSSNTA